MEYENYINNLATIFAKALSTEEMMDVIVNAKITAKMAKYRIDNNMTKLEMARLLDIDYRRYINLENGTKELKVFEIIKIGFKLDLFNEISEVFKDLYNYNQNLKNIE